MQCMLQTKARGSILYLLHREDGTVAGGVGTLVAVASQ